MGSKDTYRASVKVARQNLKDSILKAYNEYRLDTRKHRLLRQQTEIKVELENMGVVSRQIPVVVIEGRAQKINVRRVVKA